MAAPPSQPPDAAAQHAPAGQGFRAGRPATASALDELILKADRALRALVGVRETSTRGYPAETIAETVTRPVEQRHVAGLMRVNHSGEVAAQALYHGQAFVARQPETRAALLQAAAEEGDHLVWCARRIDELGGRTSLLNPLWYGGSFAIGVVAGSMGDATSFGFVAETERQVVRHLQSHLAELPRDDARTRAVIEQMCTDEAHHGGAALQAGGRDLPVPVRGMMKLAAKVMTTTARWI